MQKSVVADLIEAAIEWAEAGVPVFPTGEDKRPLTENGFYDASTDPDAITAMFKAAGNRLHGIGGRMGAEAGLFAIDADTYKEGDAGAAAKAYVADLERAGLLPQTRVHATRNGGRHYLFRAKEFPNCKPSKGVEVKGEGGYIVLPPSPGYTIEREGLATAPAALVESLKAARAAQSATTLDVLRQNVLTGDDFHDSLTQIAAKLSAGGEPLVRVQAAVMELMQASVAANPQHPRHDRWQPIMADKGGELTRIVSSGHAKYNVAAKTGNEMSQLPIVRADAYGDDFPFANKRGYFGFEKLDVLTEEFIMHPIYHASEVTLISADPKAGKTLVSQTLAMHIAAGLNFDDNLTVTERRPVLYFALESQTAIKKRLVAWRKYHDPAGDLYTDHNNFPFFTVEESLNLLDETSRINLVEQIKATEVWWQKQGEKSLGVIVIDTLTKAMPGGDQNSVEDTSAVFDIIAKIRDAEIKAAIVIIHHNTKNGNQPRGSSNIQAEPDTLLTLTRNQETDQLELRILMARSIDDDKVFTFDIVTETLGVSNQGYTITAPVLLPGVRIVPEGEDEAVVALRMEMTYKPLFDAVADLGTGSWSARTVHDHLKEKMALRSNAVDLSAFYANIFPPNGRNTDGGYNITIETGQNRSGLPLVRFFHVRRFAS